MTNREIQKRIQKLNARKQELESGMYMGQVRPFIKNAIKYFQGVYWKLPEYERQEIERSWSEYHQACSQSPQAEVFRSLKNSIGTPEGDEILKAVRKQLKEGVTDKISQPTKFNPNIWNFSDWASQYRSILFELDSLTKYQAEDAYNLVNSTQEAW